MKNLVSIIIPVYNKEHFIKKCLQSVIAQTYQEIEIIIIDDASTDYSLSITQKAAIQDSRIQIYKNEENLGLLKSRYKAIDLAKGNWTTFADADDWLEPDAIKNLIETAIRLDVDMVQMRHQRRMKGLAVKYFETFNPELTDRKIMGEEFYSLASYVGMDSHITPSCWGKIYKTDLLREAKRLNFNQFWGEDQILNINYLRQARSIAFINYIGYNYRWGGETSNYKYTMLEEFKNVHRLKLLMGQNPTDVNREIIMLLRYHIRQMITEMGWTKEAIAHTMQNETKDKIWENAGLKESIEEIIEQESESIQKKPIKYFAKRLLR